jgi:hypothetical protein
MVLATGLAKSRVDQLVREAAERDIARCNAAAAERVARHVPQASSAAPDGDTAGLDPCGKMSARVRSARAWWT